MRDEDSVRLRHMVEAAQSAIGFVSGRERADLDQDRMWQTVTMEISQVLPELLALAASGRTP